MESYTTIDALLAPVIKGDLQPLSGRYLIRLAQGRRVVALSSSVRSGLVTLVGLASCCMSRVIFLTLPSRATKSGRDRLERRQDLPVEAFYAPDESALSKVKPDHRKSFFIALSYRWLQQGILRVGRCASDHHAVDFLCRLTTTLFVEL